MSEPQTNEVMSRAQKTFREVFDKPAMVLSREMTAKEVAGWDSLNHLRLISALESEFKVRFSTQEIMTMDKVGTLLDIITKKR
jgi:acyl carrier protein